MRLQLLSILLFAATLSSPLLPQGSHEVLRQKMVDIVAVQLYHDRIGTKKSVRPVIAAMRQIPRHEFVPPALQADAYLQKPLQIGEEQTISSPYIVAAMTTLLKVGSNDRVLEIGTGSGYQAAILSQLARRVYSIEIIEPLAAAARIRLDRLGYNNVEVRAGDGYAGWPEEAPFDAIIITAGAKHVPPALLAQLKPGGRMVIPVGPGWAQRQLVLVRKRSNGKIGQRSFGQVFFVDFTGKIEDVR